MDENPVQARGRIAYLKAQHSTFIQHGWTHKSLAHYHKWRGEVSLYASYNERHNSWQLTMLAPGVYRRDGSTEPRSYATSFATVEALVAFEELAYA